MGCLPFPSGSEYGDAAVIGASSVGQLESGLDVIDQGPLPKELVDVVSGVWTEVAGEAVKYHM
jgi:aflatoxin B1 aldehyde reductase